MVQMERIQSKYLSIYVCVYDSSTNLDPVNMHMKITIIFGKSKIESVTNIYENEYVSDLRRVIS